MRSFLSRRSKQTRSIGEIRSCSRGESRAMATHGPELLGIRGEIGVSDQPPSRPVVGSCGARSLLPLGTYRARCQGAGRTLGGPTSDDPQHIGLVLALPRESVPVNRILHGAAGMSSGLSQHRPNLCSALEPAGEPLDDGALVGIGEGLPQASVRSGASWWLTGIGSNRPDLLDSWAISVISAETAAASRGEINGLLPSIASTKAMSSLL